MLSPYSPLEAVQIAHRHYKEMRQQGQDHVQALESTCAEFSLKTSAQELDRLFLHLENPVDFPPLPEGVECPDQIPDWMMP